jgi:hypothetical protein
VYFFYIGIWVPFLGYEIDVACVKKHIFVECGDTQPQKIFSIMFNGYSVGVLQYNSESIVWFRPFPDFQKCFERDAFDYFGLVCTVRQNDKTS